jgi:hypothetical protein
MGWTYDPSSGEARDMVRLRINDTDIDNPVFSDEELDAFLGSDDDDWRLAAADAIDTIALNEALVLKIIRTLDLQTDGARLAESLSKQADRLRAQVDGDGGFAIARPPARRVELGRVI